MLMVVSSVKSLGPLLKAIRFSAHICKFFLSLHFSPILNNFSFTFLFRNGQGAFNRLPDLKQNMKKCFHFECACVVCTSDDWTPLTNGVNSSDDILYGIGIQPFEMTIKKLRKFGNTKRRLSNFCSNMTVFIRSMILLLCKITCILCGTCLLIVINLNFRLKTLPKHSESQYIFHDHLRRTK